MKLSIISAGLSAALIDKVGNKSVEVLMKFGDHTPLLLLPKRSYSITGSAASGRKLDTFKQLTVRLRRDLAEQYFETHDAFDLTDIDMAPVQSNDAVVDAQPLPISGGCNDDWDWLSPDWMVNLSDLGGAGAKMKHADLMSSPHVAATLGIHGSAIQGHRPIEPVSAAFQHKVGPRQQRFTDAMRCSIAFPQKPLLKWVNRKDPMKTADLTFGNDTECLLLNLPVHADGTPHLDAFKKLPFERSLEFDNPQKKAECKYGAPLVPNGAHHSHQPDTVSVTLDAPVEALRAGVTLSFGPGQKQGRDAERGDSLCMRMIGDVTFS